MSEPQQNFRQATVGAASPDTSATLQNAVGQMTAYLQTHAFSHGDATNAAYLHSYLQLQAQARLLAFMDMFSYAWRHHAAGCVAGSVDAEVQSFVSRRTRALSWNRTAGVEKKRTHTQCNGVNHEREHNCNATNQHYFRPTLR